MNRVVVRKQKLSENFKYFGKKRSRKRVFVVVPKDPDWITFNDVKVTQVVIVEKIARSLFSEEDTLVFRRNEARK